MQAGVRDKFLRFIATKTDDAVFNPMDGYFPFSVIADAFEKGTEHGEETFKQKLRDIYVNNIETALDAVTQLLNHIEEHEYTANKLFLNHSINQTFVLIAVNDEYNIDENFIKIAYGKASEIQNEFLNSKETNIEINFIDTSNLNEELIKHDGYSFNFDFKGKVS